MNSYPGSGQGLIVKDLRRTSANIHQTLKNERMHIMHNIAKIYIKMIMMQFSVNITYSQRLNTRSIWFQYLCKS